jgi:signal peptidase I
MSELSLDGADFGGLASQILASGSDLRFRARGSSMAPFIRDGDWLVVRRVDLRLIVPGDVLLYSVASERLLAHRVIRVDRSAGETYFVLQGDSRPHPDGRFHSSQILGRVEGVERNGRHLRTAAAAHRAAVRLWTSPIGRFLFTGVHLIVKAGRRIVRGLKAPFAGNIR